MNIPENILSTLTDEQKKKVESAQTPEELIAIVRETGRELSPDQLEAVAGGESWCTRWCGKPYCNLHQGCTYTKG